jgi:hypothetical protein
MKANRQYKDSVFVSYLTSDTRNLVDQKKEPRATRLLDARGQGA